MKQNIRRFTCSVLAAMSTLGLALASSNESLITWGPQWGWSSAIQVPGDYDGDGVFDLAVYDPIGGYWYIQSLGNSKPVVNEVQGSAVGSSASPLIKFGGIVLYDPVVEGSAVIYLRDASYGYGYGAVLGTFTDNGSGQLQGTALVDGVVPIAGSGEINYATGAWYLNLALPGMVGAFYCQAHYSAGFPSQKIIAWKNQWGWYGARPVPGDYDGDGQYDLAVVDPSSGKWFIKSLKYSVMLYDSVGIENQGIAMGSSASPLTRISGILWKPPVYQGSVTIFVRNKSGLNLVGAFNDTGAGQLRGTALGEGGVSISGSGEINYATGAWYVNLGLPGLTGTNSLSATYRGR